MDRRERGWGAGVAGLSVAVLLLVWGTPGGGAPAATPLASEHGSPGQAVYESGRGVRAALMGHAVLAQQFVGASNIYEVAALGRTVLSVTFLANGSYGLVLSDLGNNTSRSLGVLPGASNIDPTSLVAAGGHFFLSVLNLSSNGNYFEAISRTGRVTTPTLPLSVSKSPWYFVYGNQTALFASAPGIVEQVNPVTHALVASYTNNFVSSFLMDSLQPVGPVLYMAGYNFNVGGKDLQYFGAFNTSTNTLTTIYEATSEPPDVYGQFVTVTLFAGDLYVGGGRFYANPNTGNFYTLNGYFYRYDPARAKLTNESSLLSTPNDWLWATEPWGSTLVLYEGTESFTSTSSSIVGGIYRMNRPGPMWTNLTSLLPATFEGDLSFVTAEGGGYLYQGGFNTASGLAELVALRT
jgi:hypothetical protein